MSLASAKNRFMKYEQPRRKNQKEAEWVPYVDGRIALFSNLDPTKQKKYVDWMMKVTIERAGERNESLFATVDSLIRTMALLIPWFHDNAQRLGDIYKFNLPDLVNEMNTHIERKKADRLGIGKLKQGKDYEVLVSNAKLAVFRPLNYAASRAIGGNCIGKKFATDNNLVMVSQTWCTTSAQEHFNKYTKIEPPIRQRLLYVMDLDKNEKWALHLLQRDDYPSTIGKGRLQIVNVYNSADQVTITWGANQKKQTAIEKAFLENLGVCKLIDEQLKELASR